MYKAFQCVVHCPKVGTVTEFCTYKVVIMAHSIYLDAELAPAGNENKFFTARMRSWRDHLLKESDWTQMGDSPLSTQKKTEWATYRQALRDFPASWTPADTADFPDQPS